jgi:hypothetical protein
MAREAKLLENLRERHAKRDRKFKLTSESISVFAISAGQWRAKLLTGRDPATQIVNKGKDCWSKRGVAGVRLLTARDAIRACEIRIPLYLRRWAKSPSFGTWLS